MYPLVNNTGWVTTLCNRGLLFSWGRCVSKFYVHSNSNLCNRGLLFSWGRCVSKFYVHSNSNLCNRGLLFSWVRRVSKFYVHSNSNLCNRGLLFSWVRCVSKFYVHSNSNLCNRGLLFSWVWCVSKYYVHSNSKFMLAYRSDRQLSPAVLPSSTLILALVLELDRLPLDRGVLDKLLELVQQVNPVWGAVSPVLILLLLLAPGAEHHQSRLPDHSTVGVLQLAGGWCMKRGEGGGINKSSILDVGCVKI